MLLRTMSEQPAINIVIQPLGASQHAGRREHRVALVFWCLVIGSALFYGLFQQPDPTGPPRDIKPWLSISWWLERNPGAFARQSPYINADWPIRAVVRRPADPHWEEALKATLNRLDIWHPYRFDDPDADRSAFWVSQDRLRLWYIAGAWVCVSRDGGATWQELRRPGWISIDSTKPSLNGRFLFLVSRLSMDSDHYEAALLHADDLTKPLDLGIHNSSFRPAAAFSSNERRIVVTSPSSDLTIFETATAQPLRQFSARAGVLVADSDLRRLALHNGAALYASRYKAEYGREAEKRAWAGPWWTDVLDAETGAAVRVEGAVDPFAEVFLRAGAWVLTYAPHDVIMSIPGKTTLRAKNAVPEGQFSVDATVSFVGGSQTILVDKGNRTSRLITFDGIRLKASDNSPKIDGQIAVDDTGTWWARRHIDFPHSPVLSISSDRGGHWERVDPVYGPAPWTYLVAGFGAFIVARRRAHLGRSEAIGYMDPDVVLASYGTRWANYAAGRALTWLRTLLGNRLPTRRLRRTARAWLRPRPLGAMIRLLAEAMFMPWRFFRRLRMHRTQLVTIEFIETYLFPAPISLAFVSAIMMQPASPRVVIGLPLTGLYLLLLFLIPRATCAILRRLLSAPPPAIKQEQLYLWYLTFVPFILAALINPDRIRTFIANLQNGCIPHYCVHEWGGGPLFVFPLSLSIAFFGQFLAYARGPRSFAAVFFIELLYLPATAFMVAASDLVNFIQLGGLEALDKFVRGIAGGAH